MQSRRWMMAGILAAMAGSISTVYFADAQQDVISATAATTAPATATTPSPATTPSTQTTIFLPPDPSTTAPTATQPTDGLARLPFIEVDVAHHQVRVACESLKVDIPLEFFCVTAGGPEHESVLRTRARPSDIHLALLMIGMKPGEPTHFDQATSQWVPPSGQPVRISVEIPRDQQMQQLPATALMRHVQSHEPMPNRTWVFDGSRVGDDGVYAADVTGYVVSIVNFDYTMIDIPDLASSSNETLQWELNPDLLPVRGTPVTMILQPVEADATQPAANNPNTDLPNSTLPATSQPATTPSVSSNPASHILLVTLDATGQLASDHVTIDQADLPRLLAERKGRGPLQIRLMIHPDAPDASVNAVRAAIDISGSPVQLIPWHSASSETLPSSAPASH